MNLQKAFAENGCRRFKDKEPVLVSSLYSQAIHTKFNSAGGWSLYWDTALYFTKVRNLHE